MASPIPWKSNLRSSRSNLIISPEVILYFVSYHLNDVYFRIYTYFISCFWGRAIDKGDKICYIEYKIYWYREEHTYYVHAVVRSS